MPPKARIVRKPSTSASTALKAPPSTASSVTRPSSPNSTATGAVAGSKEGTMLPPPDPLPPKAILESELDALAICLRNAAVKTSQVHAFFADTKRIGIHNFVTRPPHTLTDALCREIEKYDQICDLIEAQLSRAISVLQRDLDRAKAQEQAEREAEALRNLPPPVPVVVPEGNAAEPSPGPPSSVVPMDASLVLKVPGAGSFLAARRQSTISLSSLSRPQVPHKLDLSSDALRINPAELAQGLGGGLPSPVTLAPKSGRLTATSEFPPDFMAALAATEMATQSVDIDLTMLPEEGPTTALDPALGSSADRPIELDLEGMDIDMTDVHASLFGEEPTNDVPTTNPFVNTTMAVAAEDNPSQPATLLGAFNQASEGNSQGVTALPFDMNIEMDNIDFSGFPLDSMMNTSDMGLDMHALLNLDSETGIQAEGHNAAGDS